jgi:hypothetical protein
VRYDEKSFFYERFLLGWLRVAILVALSVDYRDQN